MGTIPLANNLSIYAKAGIARWDVDASGSIAGVGAAAVSDTATDFTFGVGLKYDFTKNIAARLEYQRYNNLGNNNTTGQSDVDRFSLGVVFKF